MLLLLACSHKGEPYVATGRMSMVYMILFTFVERYVLLNREPSLKDAALAEARRALRATAGRSDLWNLIPKYLTASLSTIVVPATSSVALTWSRREFLCLKTISSDFPPLTAIPHFE